MKPKVLHIISALGEGGAEGVLFRISSDDKKFVHVVVSMLDEGKYAHMLRALGVKVYSLSMNRKKITPANLLRLFSIIRSEKPDLVQTWMYHADLLGGLVAWMAGQKSIFWNIRREALQKGVSSRSSIYAAHICAYLSNIIPKGIICCGDSAAEKHSHLGYNSKKMKVIYNGIDIKKFRPNNQFRNDIRRELKLDTQMTIFGNVGRFCPEKNHLGLLNSLGEMKRRGHLFHCLLVGSEINLDNMALNSEIVRNDLGDRISLLGSRYDIERVMNAIDIYIMTSTTEGFPNALAESMACGIPCVATKVGDAEKIVGNTGWLVPINCRSALVAALECAISEKNHKDNWKNRQSASIKHIRQSFSLEQMKQAYAEVWISAYKEG